MPDPNRIYRRLLKLYPARFREEYAGPLERQFLDDYRDLATRRQRFWFWLGVLADLGTSIPGEFFRELWQDVAYALRIYRRRRLVTLLSLSALALAIGAATGVFSVVNAILLRSLPFRDPASLVELRRFPVTAGRGRQAFFAWQRGASYLAGAAAYATADINLLRGGSAQHVRAAGVSANFFQLLGAPPFLGRDFGPEEDGPGAGAVAILNYGFWQQSLGGDPQVLGSKVRLNGVPIEVVGIAPPGVEYPAGAALWTPTVFDLRLIPVNGVVAYQSMGRLATKSLAQARREYLADAAAHGRRWSADAANAAELVPIRDELAGSVRQASLALLAAVTLVLLMACANVAHLLLTRTSERREELAMRAALGASRARLVQQLTTESVLLTAAASAAGLVVAWWLARLAWTAQPAGLPSEIYTIFDWRVLAFALALAWLTGLLFGVVPASLMGRMQPQADTVRGRSGSGNTVNMMRSILVALQVALAVTLLAGCFVMGRAFLRLIGTDLGFTTARAVTLTVSLSGTLREGNTTAYYRQALDSLKAIPGIESAAATDYLPLDPHLFMAVSTKVDTGPQMPRAVLMSATPGYFESIGARIVVGRGFESTDRAGSEPVAIISDTLAALLGTSPLGRKLSSDMPGWKPLTIVGVVHPLRMGGPEFGTPLEIFRPLAQSFPPTATLVARVHGDPQRYLTLCRGAVSRVDPAVPVYAVETLDHKLRQALIGPRFYTAAIFYFGGFSLLLAVIAIYGVAAYSIEQRRHEIGVRAAMGAELGQLRVMLLRQGTIPVGAGAVAGIAGALELGPAAQHWIHAAEPASFTVCVGASVVLATAACVAIWTATRKVVKLDPMTVLRAD